MNPKVVLENLLRLWLAVGILASIAVEMAGHFNKKLTESATVLERGSLVSKQTLGVVKIFDEPHYKSYLANQTTPLDVMASWIQYAKDNAQNYTEDKLDLVNNIPKVGYCAIVEKKKVNAPYGLCNSATEGVYLVTYTKVSYDLDLAEPNVGDIVMVVKDPTFTNALSIIEAGGKKFVTMRGALEDFVSGAISVPGCRVVEDLCSPANEGLSACVHHRTAHERIREEFLHHFVGIKCDALELETTVKPISSEYFGQVVNTRNVGYNRIGVALAADNLYVLPEYLYYSNYSFGRMFIVLVQILILFGPISAFNIAAGFGQSTDLKDGLKYGTTCKVEDLIMRLSTSWIIAPQIAYYWYFSVFQFAYLRGLGIGAQDFASMWAIWRFYILSSILIFIVGTGVSRLVDTHILCEKVLSKIKPFAILYLAISEVLATMAERTFENGLECVRNSESRFNSQCASAFVTFTPMHIAMIAVGVITLVYATVIYIHQTKTYRNSSSGAANFSCRKMTKELVVQKGLTEFETHCTGTKLEVLMLTTKCYTEITTPLGRTIKCTLPEYIEWEGFVHIKALGIIRLKDFYLLISALAVPRGIISSMNLSIVFWPVTDQYTVHPGRRIRLDATSKLFKSQGLALVSGPLG